MSATSMANVALARNAREIVRAPSRGGVGRVASRAEGQTVAAPDNPVAAAMKTITTYIPTEILTVYIAGSGIFFTFTDQADAKAWAFFLGCVVGTPLVNVLVFMAKLRSAGLPLPDSLGGWPVWESVAATVAFVSYAAAIEQSPFTGEAWYDAGIAGFMVVVVAGLIGLVSAVVAPTRDIDPGTPAADPLLASADAGGNG